MLRGLLPTAVLIGLGARPLLGLFGPDYRAVVLELDLLLLGNVLWALAALPSLRLQYDGRGSTVLAISLAALVLDVALDLVVVPTYGILGAALTTAATLGAAALALGLISSTDSS
jgi:O-antigen/teichoic acid export membrane protein